MNSLNQINKLDPQFLPLSGQDKSDILTAIVTPLILIASAGIVIYYAIHPIPPMVPIFPNCSLSLPVVICGTTGIVCITILLIHISRKKSVVTAFQRAEYGAGRKWIHVGGRKPHETPADFQKSYPQTIAYTQQRVGSLVTFNTRDGVALSGYWYAAPGYKSRPTMIIFHGQNGSASTMDDLGYYYRYKNFNVLMVEYRGYALSEGVAAGPNQEMEAYLDAEAALKFVLSNGIPKNFVAAHGLSLGGAYAAALGYFFGVKNLILDHTFTTIGSICEDWFPFVSWDKHITSAYVQSRLEKDPEIPDAIDIVTDGFNTLQKIKNMKETNILVISGKKDRVMPMCFAEEFLQACYPNDPKKQQTCGILLEGEHNYDFMKTFYQNDDMDKDADEKMYTFLREIELDCHFYSIRKLFKPFEEIHRLLEESFQDNETQMPS